MTIKLYGFPMSPNARRALIALEETGESYEYVTVDLMSGGQKAPDYLALNPNGRVPTLVDGDLVLWESHAILEYLAAKHPEKRLGGGSPEELAHVSKYLFLNAAHLGPAMAGVFAHTIRLPEDKRIPTIAENGRAEATRILGLLERALTDKTALVGDRVTIADIAVGTNVALAPMLGFDLAAYPNVSRWLAELKKRPSFVKAFG
ncbi:MAG: glutathione S-transferase family protein [Polyangiaceae bacterium]|jgi:glutathione S-transferase|nr:glutathione S-transferase family protein [Polyangiaceae bacterium]MBK8941839.1 glutathione S-transferase family protein [Polyangiaceae bacterium]